MDLNGKKGIGLFSFVNLRFSFLEFGQLKETIIQKNFEIKNLLQKSGEFSVEVQQNFETIKKEMNRYEISQQKKTDYESKIFELELENDLYQQTIEKYERILRDNTKNRTNNSDEYTKRIDNLQKRLQREEDEKVNLKKHVSELKDIISKKNKKIDEYNSKFLRIKPLLNNINRIIVDDINNIPKLIPKNVDYTSNNRITEISKKVEETDEFFPFFKKPLSPKKHKKGKKNFLNTRLRKTTKKTSKKRKRKSKESNNNIKKNNVSIFSEKRVKKRRRVCKLKKPVISFRKNNTETISEYVKRIIQIFYLQYSKVNVESFEEYFIEHIYQFLNYFQKNFNQNENVYIGIINCLVESIQKKNEKILLIYDIILVFYMWYLEVQSINVFEKIFSTFQRIVTSKNISQIKIIKIYYFFGAVGFLSRYLGEYVNQNRFSIKKNIVSLFLEVITIQKLFNLSRLKLISVILSSCNIIFEKYLSKNIIKSLQVVIIERERNSNLIELVKYRTKWQFNFKYYDVLNMIINELRNFPNRNKFIPEKNEMQLVKSMEILTSQMKWVDIYNNIIFGQLWPLLRIKNNVISSIIIELVGNIGEYGIDEIEIDKNSIFFYEENEKRIKEDGIGKILEKFRMILNYRNKWDISVQIYAANSMIKLCKFDKYFSYLDDVINWVNKVENIMNFEKVIPFELNYFVNKLNSQIF